MLLRVPRCPCVVYHRGMACNCCLCVVLCVPSEHDTFFSFATSLCICSYICVCVCYLVSLRFPTSRAHIVFFLSPLPPLSLRFRTSPHHFSSPLSLSVYWISPPSVYRISSSLSSTMSLAPIQVTVEAPINIAFIKYWGKREGGEKLILPTNDSFSITLSTKPFRSKTSVELRSDLEEDELWLNGERTDVKSNPRTQSVLSRIRDSCPAALKNLKARIVSENNFPTAAGMASSASGYCALAAALVKVYESPLDISMLSRLGSGSACRSAYGGFVVWHKGERADGEDCVATQFKDERFWPEMQVMCAVLKGAQKDVSSTAGMQQSLKTSPLMAERIAKVVPQRMKAVSEAILAKDFEAFASIAMADSDDLQEICRTTTPRIQYATEDSYAMIRLIKAFNAKSGRNVVGYTFDAGANCFMFTLKKDLPEVVAMLMAHFPTPHDRFCFNDPALLEQCKTTAVSDDFKNLIEHPKKAFELLLQSPIGSGVHTVDDSESLMKK